MVWMLCVIKVLGKFVVLEIHIGNAWGVSNHSRVVDAVGSITSRELLEFHDILSESACLVTEDEMHHAKFLVEIG